MLSLRPVYLACSLAAIAASPVWAAEAEAKADVAAEPASPHHISTNFGFYSDYIFRGISYARGRGAIQAFVDYSHDSGLFLGIGGTNVHRDALYGNTLEVDIYGGFSVPVTDDLTITPGFLQFYYPDNEKIANQSPNVTEVNLAANYKDIGIKYSYSLTDWFGVNTKSYGNTEIGNHTTGTGDSKGTNYIEINYNPALPFFGLSLLLHVGHQSVKNYAVADYTDFLVGVSKDFSIANSDGWNAGLSYITTDANDDWYVTSTGYKTGNDKLFAYIKRTF